MSCAAPYPIAYIRALLLLTLAWLVGALAIWFGWSPSVTPEGLFGLLPLVGSLLTSLPLLIFTGGIASYMISQLQPIAGMTLLAATTVWEIIRRSKVTPRADSTTASSSSRAIWQSGDLTDTMLLGAELVASFAIPLSLVTQVKTPFMRSYGAYIVLGSILCFAVIWPLVLEWLQECSGGGDAADALARLAPAEDRKIVEGILAEQRSRLRAELATEDQTERQPEPA